MGEWLQSIGQARLGEPFNNRIRVAQGDTMSSEGDEQLLRHARKPIRWSVLISMGSFSWVTEVENMSATGLLAVRPAEWRGAVGERCVVDMFVGNNSQIHLEVKVSRVTATELAFRYTRIPEQKERAFWELLGQYADILDQPIEAAAQN